MTDSKKYTFKKILFDSGMIMFSVLLALFIDEWKTNYNEEVETKKMLENIKLEITKNQKFVKNAISYQDSILQRTAKIVEQDSIEEKLYSATYGFMIRDIAPNGISQGRIYDIAWTVAKANQITNRISLERAQVLHNVYDQQIIVRAALDDIIQVLTDRESLRKERLRETVILYMSTTGEFAGRLRYLDNLYSEALKELEN